MEGGESTHKEANFQEGGRKSKGPALGWSKKKTVGNLKPGGDHIAQKLGSRKKEEANKNRPP